jgi:hypothetical protein
MAAVIIITHFIPNPTQSIYVEEPVVLPAGVAVENESLTSMVLTDRCVPCCLLKLSRYLRRASLIRSERVLCSH